MSFSPAHLQKDGPQTIPGGLVPKVPQIWSYYANNDTMETVLAPGYFRYFADFTTSSLFYPELAVNDLIYVVANGSNAWITVTAVSPAILTTSYDGTLIPTAGVITAAQFKGMYATPILLVSAFGLNTMLLPNTFVVFNDFGTTAFTAGGTWGIQYGNAAHGAGILASTTQLAAVPLAWTGNSIVTMSGVITGVEGENTAASIINQGLYLSNATQAFASGDSTLYYNLTYSIIASPF